MSVYKCNAARSQDSDNLQGFQVCAPKVWRFLRYLGVLESDLARVCRQTFVSAGVLGGLDEESMRTVYQSAIRVWCSYEPQSGIAFQASERTSQAESARLELLELFARLSPQQRIVTALYEIEGLSTEQIADVLGESREHVLSVLSQARAELIRERPRYATA